MLMLNTYGSALLASTLLVLAAIPSEGLAQSQPRTCFYAVDIDGRPARLCEGDDVYDFANNVNVRRAIETLGLQSKTIRFRGCEGADYSTAKATDEAGHAIYKITYPLDKDGRYFAPIVHELAHVLQMDMAGGPIALDAYGSKKIELGADYTAGMVSATLLKDVDIRTFQHGLLLMGRYFDRSHDAHGTPEQRTTAFRRGRFFRSNEDVPDIRAAISHFYQETYAELVPN
ncbi:MAG: hypothetical protein ACREP7_23205 [Lysobacter sp.]